MKTQTAQTEKKLTKKQIRLIRLDQHYDRCAKLATACGHPCPDGKKISVALWKLEKEAHDSATAQCNGTAYNGQPFRPTWDEDTGEEVNESVWDKYRLTVRERVGRILGSVPAGFFLNSDARGYALKIDPDRGGKALIEAVGMHKDWGSYGILSPEIE